MKRSRRWALGILAALCLGAGALAMERTCYPVEPDLSGLETGLQDFWMRGRPAGTPPEMLIHQHLPVGDRIYVLFEVGPELDLGTAALERSWTGRWRVDRLGWGGGNVRRRWWKQAGGNISCWAESRRADRQRRFHTGWDRLSGGDPAPAPLPGLHGGGWPNGSCPPGFGDSDLVQCPGRRGHCGLHTARQRGVKRTFKKITGVGIPSDAHACCYSRILGAKQNPGEDLLHPAGQTPGGPPGSSGPRQRPSRCPRCRGPRTRRPGSGPAPHRGPPAGRPSVASRSSVNPAATPWAPGQAAAGDSRSADPKRRPSGPGSPGRSSPERGRYCQETPPPGPWGPPPQSGAGPSPALRRCGGSPGH